MHTTKKDNSYINKTIFGFWLYIMSDCILFASLFATHAVLSSNHYIYLSLNKNIFNLTLIFLETCCLLFSSLTYSKSMIYANAMNIQELKKWLIITLLLGVFFINIEIYEFYHLILHHYTPCSNAFFSSFFILVGTHGIHVIAGLIWIIIMIIHISCKGLTKINLNRLKCLSLFWHFLDIIWICVFTEVYLIGILYL